VSGPANLQAEDRAEEMHWLSQESGRYPGQCVALQRPRLVAHRIRLSAVIANAKAAGVADPFFVHLPAINDLPFSAKSLDL